LRIVTVSAGKSPVLATVIVNTTAAPPMIGVVLLVAGDTVPDTDRSVPDRPLPPPHPATSSATPNAADAARPRILISTSLEDTRTAPAHRCAGDAYGRTATILRAGFCCLVACSLHATPTA
jgi:hypothetical protein